MRTNQTIHPPDRCLQNSGIRIRRNLTNYMKSKSTIACLTLLAASAMHVGAENFTPLVLPERDTDIRTFSDGTTYAPLFSAGSQELEGVPFQFDADESGNTAYIGSSALHIPVNISGVTTAYTLINIVWGTQGSLAGTLTFNGSGGLSYGVDLTVGVNVRDHFYGTFVNTTSDPSTVDAVWGDPNPGHAHLDMQIISLPAAFAAATLEEVIFEPLGDFPAGHAFLVAATVAMDAPPVANTGGPYTINQGSGLSLDASGSYDPDVETGDAIASYAWDLNNDGIYDSSLATPTLTLTAAQLASLGLGGGSHTIGLRLTDTFGASGTATTTLTIRPPQTIDFAPIGNHTLGDAPFTISATASSELPVTFTSLTPDVVTVEGNTVTIIGAGAATIRASQAGNESYQPAADAEQPFTVFKAAPIITWNTPDPITVGTALGSEQLNATANLEGTFVYDPPTGAVLSEGAHTLSVTFTPSAAANYSVANASVQLEVIGTIGGKCPLGKGYWKNHPTDWPVNGLILGTRTYTEPQLLAVLMTPIGAGNRADASLILADQLVAAKLNIANGSNPSLVQGVVAAADALIGNRSILIVPKITPNTDEGAQMVRLAGTLEQFNSGVTSPGCSP
jgi:hypothetical protein